jgi:hypothetical protein
MHRLRPRLGRLRLAVVVVTGRNPDRRLSGAEQQQAYADGWADRAKIGERNDAATGSPGSSRDSRPASAPRPPTGPSPRAWRCAVADMLAAALAYAARGWPVFPCVANGKEPVTPHGFKDATTDPHVITAWWARAPRRNVAVATGAPGPDVLDVDVKNGAPGMELFERARRAGLLRGAAAIVRTPSGGLHLWFDGTDQAQGAIPPRKALELKAHLGYVLLPPSYVEADTYAGTYELIERRDTAATLDFAAVRRLLDPPPQRPRNGTFRGEADVGPLARWLAAQPEGNRNHATFWAACKALAAGHDDLAPLVETAISCGLSEREARRTVQSAQRRIRGAA